MGEYQTYIIHGLLKFTIKRVLLSYLMSKYVIAGLYLSQIWTIFQVYTRVKKENSVRLYTYVFIFQVYTYVCFIFQVYTHVFFNFSSIYFSQKLNSDRLYTWIKSKQWPGLYLGKKQILLEYIHALIRRNMSIWFRYKTIILLVCNLANN